MLRTIQGYMMIAVAIMMWIAMDHADTQRELFAFFVSGIGACGLAAAYFVLALLKR